MKRILPALLIVTLLALPGRDRLDPLMLLLLAGLGLALASALVGSAIEAVARSQGPVIGRLLDAFLGSSAELLVAAFALRAGMRELVKASITGSILGNLLLLLGLSALLGGVRNGRQYFDRERASHAATLMVISVVALTVPAVYGLLGGARNSGPVETLSEAVAAVMILVFFLAIYYQLNQIGELEGGPRLPPSGRESPTALASMLLVVGLLATAGYAALLVDTVEPVEAGHGLGPTFIGVLMVPLAGNLAEHHLSLRAAWRNRMDLALDIGTGASMQVALLVAPVLVFLSLLIGTPMDLIFSPLELAALAAAAAVAALVAHDGRTTWLEGVMLMAVYALMVLGFFWWPG